MAHINSTHLVYPSLDTTCAGVARVHDAALGGKDNYSVDRDLVAELEHVAPGFSDLVRAEGAWHIRAVRYLASIGVDQFLDCGVGLPTPFDNTHEPGAPAPATDGNPGAGRFMLTPGSNVLRLLRRWANHAEDHPAPGAAQQQRRRAP